MSVAHEEVCDHCGKPEGFLHIDAETAREEALAKGWFLVEETGEVLCQDCKAKDGAEAATVGPVVEHNDYCCGMMGEYAGDACPGIAAVNQVRLIAKAAPDLLAALEAVEDAEALVQQGSEWSQALQTTDASHLVPAAIAKARGEKSNAEKFDDGVRAAQEAYLVDRPTRSA